jgi:phosphoglycolate phosphatase
MEIIKPKAVLFDWDNTLVDTWPVIASAINATFEHFDKEKLTLEQVKANSHRSLKDSFPLIFGEEWPTARSFYYEKYREYADKGISPLQNAEQVLKILINNSVKVGLVSNKLGENLRKEVAVLGWENYFFSAIGSMDAVRDKPHPEPVYKALNVLDIKPSHEVWFVGDTTVDIECANNTGCLPVLYGDKSSSPDLDGKKIKHINIQDHFELERIITGFF